MQDRDDKRQSADFGIFYPIGHMVVAFSDYDDALHVQQDLITGGYDPKDCVVYRSEEVVAAASSNLAANTGWLARLGGSDEAVRRHLEAARAGAAFAVLYAPNDLDAERAMNVIRRVPFEFAHRYHRFAIETLT